MGAGHQGPSGRYDAWKDEAFVFAFMLDALGLAPAPPDVRAGAPDPVGSGAPVVQGVVGAGFTTRTVITTSPYAT